MNEIDVLQSLRPEVAPLDPAVKSDLRRSIFGAPATVGDQPSAARAGGGEGRSHRVTSTRPSPQRARWMPAVAAAALAIAGTTGLWALTTRRSSQPSAQGAAVGEAAGVETTPLPDWYEPVQALLPPGFDHIAIMSAPQDLHDGELYVVAAQPSSGLVLDIAIDTRTQSTNVDIEDDWFTDQWGSYLDNIERTTLVTPDRRWVRVRCGVTVIEGATGESASEVAATNDVCDAAGGPTVTDRREVAARFVDAADRGELAAVLIAASASPPAVELPEAASDELESMPSVVPGMHIFGHNGRSQSIEVQSGAAGGLTTHVGILYGVLPAAGDPDPQVHRISLGARSDRSLASYPEVPTVDQIATVTFVRDGVLYQAVTADVSDSHLAGLTDLVRQLAAGPVSSITVPPTPSQPTIPSTDVAATPEGDEPSWYRPIRALLPAGFDYITVVPDDPTTTKEGVTVLAIDSSAGLVLDINLSLVSEIDMPAIDAWEYHEFVGGTNVLTLDGNLVMVRCGVTFTDDYSPPAPTSGVDKANDVCSAAGGLTPSDRRAVADAFANAADAGELTMLDEVVAQQSSPPALGVEVLPVVESLFGDLGEKPLAFYDFTGATEEIELPSQPGGDYTTTLSVLRGVVNPTASPSTEVQVNRITLGGAADAPVPGRGPEDEYPEVPVSGEIASLTLVKGDIVYLAVTSDVSSGHLEALAALMSDVAEQVASAPPVAPAPPLEESETTMPRDWFQNRLAVGDTVLESAATTLHEHGWQVAAQMDYTPGDVLTQLEKLAGRGIENDLVLVHIGNNGQLTPEQIDAVLAPLADAELVVLYNINADRPWRDANNELLAQAATSHPNVQLIDWNALASSCPGDCFYDDAMHLRPDGASYYEQLATDAWRNR